MNLITVILLLLFIAYIFYMAIKDKTIILKIYLFCLLIVHYVAFYLNYSINLKIKKDSFIFYTRALEANSILDFSFLGSQFMSVIAYPLVKICGISYFVISLIFATISFFAFLKYTNYLISNFNVRESNVLKFILLLFLMPSLHFWTAGLTKEALIVFFMCTMFFHIKSNKLITISLIISLLFILLIRPYVFGVVLVSYFVHLVFNTKFSIRKKVYSAVTGLIVLLVFIPILKGFLKIKTFNLNEMQAAFQRIVVYSQNNGDSSIDLENSTYLGRLFLVLFRPLFYDAKNVFQYLISFENLINILVLSGFTVFICIKKQYKSIFKKHIFLSLTVMSLILFFSIYLYNLGLASRMRVMFLPYLYILIFTHFVKNENLNET